MAALRDTYVHPGDATIIGADVASGHGEDSSVIYVRKGLALTFSAPVFTAQSFVGRGDHLVVSEYNPWSREAMEGEPLPEATSAGQYYAEGWARLKPEYE
jgi:hypothetical protein